jgi:hypothetical protein
MTERIQAAKPGVLTVWSSAEKNPSLGQRMTGKWAGMGSIHYRVQGRQL